MMKLFGPYKKSSKTASMQLSINAIVILVMAMAVLGLGLGIIKGIRGQANKFLDIDVDISETASSSNPITNFKSVVSMIVDKEEPQMGISFYSRSGDCDSDENPAKVDIVCSEGLSDSEDLTMEIRQRGTKIGAGDVGTIQFAPKATSEGGFEPEKSYFCSLNVYCKTIDKPEETFQFTLNT